METLEVTASQIALGINPNTPVEILTRVPDLVLCAECQEYVPLEETQMFGDGKYYCIDGCEKRVKWFC